MENVILYLSGFSFVAINGIIKIIREKEDLDMQGLLIQRLIRSKAIYTIGLLSPLVAWFQIYDLTPTNLLLITGLNTILVLFLCKIIATPFLLRISINQNKYSPNRAKALVNTFLVAMASLILGSILNNL